MGMCWLGLPTNNHLCAGKSMSTRSASNAFRDALVASRVLDRVIKLAANDAKVKTFLTILRSYLTQFDQKLEKKQPNIYRLGHYLGAADKVESAVKSHLNDDSGEAMEALSSALKKNFESDFPPLKKVLKLVDEWQHDKKLPKLGKM